MAERRAPWLKFYTSDWRADPGLRMCSYAARGLWLDMLTLMHEAEPYGHLMIGSVAPDAADLAALLGGSAKEVGALLDQLEKRGVFSRTDAGCIYSRRMVRDAEQAERDKAHGRNGGNPRLKGSGNPPDNPSPNAPDNPNHKGGVNPPDKAQKPEARDQKEYSQAALSKPPREPSPSPSPSSSAPTPIMPRQSDPPQRWIHLGDKREIDDQGATHAVVGGYYLDQAAVAVCEAAGLHDGAWRPDWRPLMAWLRDGLEVPAMCDAIRRVAARGNYRPPASLGYFDQVVRERSAA